MAEKAGDGVKTLTKIIRGVLIYWIIFVAVSWAAFFTRGSVPDTLIQYGLGGGCAELICGAVIEIAKHYVNNKFTKEEKGEDDDGIELFSFNDNPERCERTADTSSKKADG